MSSTEATRGTPRTSRRSSGPPTRAAGRRRAAASARPDDDGCPCCPPWSSSSSRPSCRSSSPSSCRSWTGTRCVRTSVASPGSTTTSPSSPTPRSGRRGLDDHRADRHRRRRQPGPRHADRAAAGPQVPRSGRGPHDDDRAVPRRPRRGGAAVEARAAQPVLRPVQRCAHVDLEPVRLLQPTAGRVAAGLPAAVDRDVADLAVDPVHDADHPRRPAVQAAGRRRGRPGGRGQRAPDLPVPDLPAPAPLPGARRSARAASTSSRTSTRSSS